MPLLSLSAAAVAEDMSFDYVPLIFRGEESAPAAPAPAAPAAKPSAPATAASGKQNVRVLIVPPREAKLSALMEGRLTSMPKAPGAAFRQGEVLAEFDCRSQKAEMAMSAARLEKAQRAYESQQSLVKLNASSNLDVAMAKADLAEAKARHQQTEVNVDRCVIVAPYAGWVVRRAANQFETVAAGTPVIEIVESGALRLELLVPSKWLRWLKAGQSFKVHVDEIDRDVPARISSLGSRVDPVSQTIAVRAELVQQVPGVLPGMSGSAIFENAGK